MNTHPIFGQMINGMLEAQQTLAMRSPDLTPPDLTPPQPLAGPTMTTDHAIPVFSDLALNDRRLAGMASPGMEPPRPMGCPNCAQAEAQVDRLAQRIRELEAEGADMAFAGHMIAAERAQDRIRELESALNLEAKARVAAAEMAHTAKLAQAQAEGDATSMLMLLAQIREAVGDNGRRMQGELIDYLRILWEEADPDRVSAREAEVRAQDYATPHDPSDAGAWGEDRFEAAS